MSCEQPLPTDHHHDMNELTAGRRFVELADLTCPGCGGPVADTAAGFIHPDGTSLCHHGDGTGSEPIETRR